MASKPRAKKPGKADQVETAAGPDSDPSIVVGKSGKYEKLDLKFGNRHGLVTGATGTGKTVTLQVLAEGFSLAGVPVFAADVKGDLSGIAAAGQPWILLTDADGQFDLTQLEDFLPFAPDHDVLVGHRIARHDPLRRGDGSGSDRKAKRKGGKVIIRGLTLSLKLSEPIP